MEEIIIKARIQPSKSAYDIRIMPIVKSKMYKKTSGELLKFPFLLTDGLAELFFKVKRRLDIMVKNVAIINLRRSPKAIKNEKANPYIKADINAITISYKENEII